MVAAQGSLQKWVGSKDGHSGSVEVIISILSNLTIIFFLFFLSGVYHLTIGGRGSVYSACYPG